MCLCTYPAGSCFHRSASIPTDQLILADLLLISQNIALPSLSEAVLPMSIVVEFLFSFRIKIKVISVLKY